MNPSEPVSPGSIGVGRVERLAPGAYRFDPVHTFAQFRVKHLIVGLVDGRFDSIKGEFCVTDNAKALFDRIDVRIDAAGIDTGVGARDEDLRSARFFDAARFPMLTFKGTDSAQVSEALWAVAGDLTIRAVTHRIALDVTLRGATVGQRGMTRIGLTAATKASRSDFDLTTELLQESGETGALDVEIQLDVEAVLELPDST